MDLSKLSSTFNEYDSLQSIMPMLEFVPGSVGALYDLYKAVGPGMPEDLTKTAVQTSVPGLPAHHFNYDEGHAGRFSVPHTDGASVNFRWVMEQSDPARFILDHLTFRDSPVQSAADEASSAASNEEKTEALGDAVNGKPKSASAVLNQEEEMRIFIPGLNTLHQPRPGESTTVQRLNYYVDVTGLSMSQMHIGTSFDQGDVDIESTAALRALFTNPLLPDSLRPQDNGSRMHWDSRQVDRVQAGLSKLNMIDTPVKEHVRYLLDLLVGSGVEAGEQQQQRSSFSSGLVLIAYSRGSIEVEAALRSFVEASLSSSSSLGKAELERRLREKVTVMTIGSATSSFPDGPAYIHLAAWNDPLASKSGVTATNNPQGGGKDAIFLNCNSPYNPDAFDNHNFGALSSQFLSVVLRANDAHNLRQLWQLGHDGKLVTPADGDELTRAMIQLTRGYEHLWDAEAAWKDVAYGALPSNEAAEKLLSDRLGEEFTKRMLKKFSN